jgi:tetratricopeptide (TPR) repeat protein
MKAHESYNSFLMNKPSFCGVHRLILILLVIIINAPPKTFAQVGDINPNEYYAYDLGIGFAYKYLTALTSPKHEYVSHEITAIARYPIPTLKMLAPTLSLGLVTTLVNEQAENELEGKWDHNQFFGMIGAGYTERLSKQFEVGGDLMIGLSATIFDSLYAENPDTTYGTMNFLASLTGRVALDPSYNFSINVEASLKYGVALGDLREFNDLLFGFGGNIQYRFGEDPDSAPEIIRAIKFGEPEIDVLFAALQSWYVNNPIGSVEITNIMSYPITDIEVSFFQPATMDNATLIAQIPDLLPNDPRKIDITASFNSDVFDLINVTPLTGEIKVSYVAKNKPAAQSRTVDYELHDKNAMTWTDDRKVASYITPRDSALVNFTDAIRRYNENYVNSGLNEKLQIAMMIYSGLTVTGCDYQLDVVSAFDQVQDNPLIIDVVNLPRTTLKRGYGDCDDLTVLYNSLLEAASIETAFITTPGHIYSALNTELPASESRMLHPDDSLLLAFEGQLWVPVEITMLGTDDFAAAWRRGAEEWNGNASQDRSFYRTREAQQTYRPVQLQETDLGLQYGESDRMVDLFRDEKDSHIQQIIDSFSDEAQEQDNKRSYNDLGIIAAKFEKYSQAEAAFTRSISLDRNYTSPQVNLGNVYLLQERYFDAIEMYTSSEKILIDRRRKDSDLHLRIVLGLSRAYYELENYNKAIELYEYVNSINAELAAEYSYLAQSPGTTQ